MPEIVKELEPKIAKVSEIDQKAQENKTARELPPKPGQNVSFKELKDWLALLPEGAEDRVSIWVYRLDPVINRQLVNPEADNNIDSIYCGFKDLGEDYFIQRHGGGSYRLIVKDEDKGKPIKGGFFQASLYIPMIIHPPKLNLKEVEWDNTKNKGYRSWAIAQRLITENNMPVIEKKEGDNTTASGDSMVQAMKLAMDFASRMSEKEQTQLKRQLGGEDALTKSMGDLFLEKMKQDDPNKQMVALTTMMTAIRGMQPEVKPDNTLAVIMPMFMTMISQMQESAKQQFQMMMEMMKKGNEPKEGNEGSNDIEKLRAIIELAKEVKGGGPAHEKSTAEVIGEIVSPILGPVLNIVANITAANAATKGVKVTPPMTATEVANDMNKQQTQQTQQQPIAALPVNEAANIIGQFEPIIINKLAGEGWEFGAWVADGFGDMTAAGIIKYGPEGLLTAAKSVPSFWAKIEATYGEAHLKKWLESLCNYKEEMRKMDEDFDGNELEEEVKGEKK